MDPLVSGSIWLDSNKPQNIHWLKASSSWPALHAPSMRTLSTRLDLCRKGGIKIHFNVEMRTRETHFVNTAVFHSWGHSTGYVYFSLAHYSLRIAAHILFPAQLNSLWSVWPFALQTWWVDLFYWEGTTTCQKCRMFLISEITHTHARPCVLNLLCLFSMVTWGCLSAEAWRGTQQFHMSNANKTLFLSPIFFIRPLILLSDLSYRFCLN